MDWLIELWQAFVSYMLGRSGKVQTQGTGYSGETTTGTSTTPETQNNLVLPHPEEPRDDSRTLENTPVDYGLLLWKKSYKISDENYAYFNSHTRVRLVDPFLIDGKEYPAGTYDIESGRALDIEPRWYNAGVTGHEEGHNSYALLTVEQVEEFNTLFNHYKQNDPLIKYLFSINSYGLTNNVEGHAEVYRYLGEKMPEPLKQFYKNLF